MAFNNPKERYNLDLARFRELLQKEVSAACDRGAFMDSLRLFKQRMEGEIVALLEKNEIGIEEMLVSLTSLAEVCLEAAYRFEEREIGQTPGSSFYIVAMGKFGGFEMTLSSDLDLIFLFDPKMPKMEDVLKDQEYFVRLVQRIISNLSVLTSRGRVYSIDAKLRPSGRAGVLVSSWSAFREYHATQARTWEKQALLKSRSVAARPGMAMEMDRRISGEIWNRSYDGRIAAEIHDLRCRMEKELSKEGRDYYDIKYGSGGVVDVEFAVQYLQLCNGKSFPSICSPHTLTALRLLSDRDIVDVATAALMEEAYLFFRLLGTWLRKIEGRAIDALPRRNSSVGERVAHMMGYHRFEELLERCDGYKREVRLAYKEILNV